MKETHIIKESVSGEAQNRGNLCTGILEHFAFSEPVWGLKTTSLFA